MTGELVQRLDLRGLDPPEPMRRALEAVEALDPGQTVELLTDREPLLLHRELKFRGHVYSMRLAPRASARRFAATAR